MFKLPELSTEVLRLRKQGRFYWIPAIVHPETVLQWWDIIIDPNQPISKTISIWNIWCCDYDPATFIHLFDTKKNLLRSWHGLRFSAPFWEHSDLQSDLSFLFSKVIYPHYGIRDTAKGIITFNSISNDSKNTVTSSIYTTIYFSTQTY